MIKLGPKEILNRKYLNSIGEYFLAGHVACKSKKPMIKTAKGLYELFANTPLLIDPTRSISPCGSLRSGAYCPIFNGQVLINHEMLSNSLLKIHSGKEVNAIQKVLTEYWDQYNLHTMWQGHGTLDYPTILQRGLPFYRKKIQDKLCANEKAGNHKKSDFFQAISIVMQGIDCLIERYVNECDRLLKEAEPQDIPRLQRLQESFRQMATGTPRNFYEAVQFTHFFNAVDGFDNAGRMDQYLLPYFRDDIENGQLDEKTAEDLLTEMFDIWGSVTFWNIVIGGTTPEGNDSSNELTFIILKARGRVDRPNPNLSLRLSPESPDELFEAAFDTLLQGQGQPAIYNNDLYVQTLKKIGIPQEDAVEFVFGGCSETHITGKSSIRDDVLNVVTPLLQTFDSKNVTSETTSPSPSEKPSDFNDFFDNYKQNLREVIDAHVTRRNTTQKYIAENQPALVRSIFVTGCIEKEMNYSEGGALYNHGMIDIYGIPNAANSLYVIKKLVYEEQKVSLSAFHNALISNFSGYEDLRKICLDQPRYGNDIDTVDSLAKEVSDYIFSYIQEHKIWNGDIFYGFCASSPGQYVSLGKDTGATPDGRLAGTPLANSMGPVQGTDLHGPTATLNSVTKLDLSKAIGTPVINLSFTKKMFLERCHAVTALIRTFFQKGGMQLQFNIVDKGTLIDALKQPENYGNLIVRVSGYSAYFTRLPKAIKEELIERTFH